MDTVVAESQYRAALATDDRYRAKRVSAMVRIKNEERFLELALGSIVGLVDEVVLIDNLSTDRSPEIIERFRAQYPAKVVSYQYHYDIRRVGRETSELAAEPDGYKSPHLSANYYNWCLARCTQPFVLKWDGDMIAMPCFAEAFNEWRRTDRAVMRFQGANVHPDLQHLLASKCKDRELLSERLSPPKVPIWTATLSYDAVEPRLFPRAFAHYDSSLGWTQTLVTPFCRPELRTAFCQDAKGPLFLHLKFCKADPYEGYSPDLAEVIEQNITLGPPLDAETLAVLRPLTRAFVSTP